MGKKLYANEPMKYFFDKLSSNSPEPGGGSASALVGATAAGLCGMLASLTINKKGYEEHWDNMKEILKKANLLKEEMLELLQKDTEAFEDASKAFKMPKDTEEQREERAKAIEAGLKKATEVPFAIMEKSLEISRLAINTLKNGNSMAITDGAISALFAEASAIGAMFNVRINLKWMKDKDYVSKMEKRLNDILIEAKKIKEEAIDYTLKEII